MKLTTLIFSLYLLAGCQSDSGTSNSPALVDHSSAPADSAAETDPVVESGLLASDTDVTAPAFPDDFTSFLAAVMPLWRLISKTEWLATDYLESYNANDAIAEKIYYETEVLLEANLNGDELLDYAALLIDADNNVMLWAFHRTTDGFDSFQVSLEGQVQGCCVGAGIALHEPGLVKNPFYDGEGIEEVNLKHDGIVYMIYEKSARLYYFDGSAYQYFFLSD